MRLSVVSLALATCLLAIPAAGASADTCPNETLRAETNSGRLPDCRAYELVTPPYKEGAFVGQLSGMLGLAPDGEHLIGTSLGVFAGSEDGTLGGDSRLRGTAYEFSRTPAGWVAAPLGPPEFVYRSEGMYDASADLSATLWGLAQLSQPEGVSDLYVERPRGTFTEIGPPTPPGVVNANEYTYLGASANLSHVLFSTEPGYRWSFDGTLGAASTLYEYVGTGNAAPSLVGVSGGAGSTELVSQCGTLLGSSDPKRAGGSVYNAVSADGSRVFFTAVGKDDEDCGGSEPTVDELLSREEVAPGELRTVPISEPTPTYCQEAPALPCADAHFEGASQGGSEVFFSSTQRLLPAASEGTANLYEYDFQAPAGENLTLVSAGGAPAEVQGVVRISEDGSHVYFVAKGVLSTAADNAGAVARAGEDNLYVYERDAQFPAGRTSFIATLSPQDEADWARADDRPALASQEGRYLEFTSAADLLDEGLVPGVAQVFQYDAQTGVLVRASIGASGFDGDGLTPAYGATLATQQADVFDSPTSAVGTSAPANGAVFFESPTALTPQALDDEIDALGEPVPNVYEYRAGNISLLSDGRDTSTVDGGPGVRLLGADSSGENAFFTTVDPLVAQDTDTQQDIYDARVDGGFPAPQPASSCVGEACRGPLSVAPVLPVGSTTRATGAPLIAQVGDTPSSDPASFGIEDFAMQALDAGSAPETQAGGHPDSLTTSFELNTSTEEGGGGLSHQLTGDVKDIVLSLPTGLTIDPQAAAMCALYELQLAPEETECPAASRIGTLVLKRIGEGQAAIQESEPIAVYNMVPEPGYPMEFGVSYLGKPILMYGSVVRMGSGYGLRLAVPGVPDLGLIGSSLTLFGDPAGRDGTGSPSMSLLTNPVDCGEGPLSARLEVDSWQHPGQYQAVETVAYNEVTGCEALQFQPMLSVTPETTRAGEPAGYDFEIRVPQHEDPAEPGTPELKNATVTLPMGVSLSPAAADGLVGCPAEGLAGINIGDSEAGELGPDGLLHTAPGLCPEASRVGTVEITTPLLPAPLSGHVFVGCGGEEEASCAEPDPLGGGQIGIYLEAEGSGVIVKLAGTVTVDEATDQLTMVFDELPQLPFSELALHLWGGPRAVLANPKICGTATTTSQLAAWSSPITPLVTPTSAFSVTECASPPPTSPPPTAPPVAGPPAPPPALGQGGMSSAGGTSQGGKPVVTSKTSKKATKAKRRLKKHRKHGGKPKQKRGKRNAKTKPKRGDR